MLSTQSAPLIFPVAQIPLMHPSPGIQLVALQASPLARQVETVPGSAHFFSPGVQIGGGLQTPAAQICGVWQGVVSNPVPSARQIFTAAAPSHNCSAGSQTGLIIVPLTSLPVSVGGVWDTSGFVWLSASGILSVVPSAQL